MQTLKLRSPVNPSVGLQRGLEVINLSKHFRPTEDQFRVLKKGLTFVPTPKINREMKKQLCMDIQQYHRRLLLTSYFRYRGKTEPLPFTPKATWTPKLSQVPNQVRKLIRADKYAIKSLSWKPLQNSNLNIPERQALVQLQKNKNIVIKPADKGSAVVIMDRIAYVQEAYRQLNQSCYYQKLEEPLYLKTGQKIRKILQKLKDEGFINRKQLAYLMGSDNPRPRLFYLLPKIHKDPKSWSIPFETPPGRPIVSDCGSDTYATAEYIEHFLNPLSTQHPSYIKDSYDFIGKIRSLHLPVDCFLFTIDIDSLYTNIDISAGLEAVREWFTRYPDKNRPEKQLLELLEINLTRNDFEFNSEYFLQVKGTAMGKRFAPSYANIFMAKWEEGALAAWPIKPLHYYRFLDDIWGVWLGSEQDFKEFINHINQFHESIKVKYTLHPSEINFLDTITYKGKDFIHTRQLQTRVYFKDTDTHALLHKESFHPKHTFRGIVKSQLLRFHKICSRTKEFWQASNILFKSLRKRGYSRSFLRGCLKKFLTYIEQNNRISPQSTEVIPFVSTFSDSSINLNRKIKENFNRFMTEGEILNGYKVISAYRKNDNIKGLLVKSKLQPLRGNKNRDITGQKFQPKRYITNPNTKQIFKIGPHLNPRLPNWVYLIYCNKCNLQYVGETGNTLLMRMTQHSYNIRRKKETHRWIVKHFLHHGLEALRFMGLQHNGNWSQKARRQAEGDWIRKLCSKYPWGLNEKGDTG